MISAIRPNDWELPLFLHVLGAMLLVGALVVVVSSLLLAWRTEGAQAPALRRIGFWSLLVATIPSWLLMRVAGQWIYAEEGWDDAPEEPGWIGIGYVTGDLGLPLLVIATILAGIGVRRARAADAGGRTVANVAAVIAALLLIAYVVTMWAMTAKPD